MKFPERAATISRRSHLVWSSNTDLLPIYAIMVVIVVATAVLQGQLFSTANITDLLVQLAPYILTAMAQSLVMLLAGVDLSVGAVMSLASTLLATRLGHGGGDLLIVIGVLVVTGLIGAATGVFISLFELPAIVVTLATSFLWGGLALAVLPQPGGNVPTNTALWVIGDYGGVPLTAVLLVLCFAVWAYMRRTRAGLRLYAVGASPKAARSTGLNVLRSHAIAYGLAGVLTGLAALVISAQTGSGDPNIGDPFTLSSIAAAVLGGVSFFGGEAKMAGSVAGGIVIGMIVNLLLYAHVSSFYQYIAEGVILVAAVAFSARRKGVSLAALATGSSGVAQLGGQEP